MAKSGVDAAIDKLKAQIMDLQRAIDALTGVREPAAEPRVKRGRKKKGLPSEAVNVGI